MADVVALTGATGFIGRYIARDLFSHDYSVRAWHRPESDRSGMSDKIQWVEGQLGSDEDTKGLVKGARYVVHSALYHPGGGFRGGEGSMADFIERNVLGTLKLIEGAIKAGVEGFIFLSTCAVHDRILSDRPLDEAHPLWSESHYGAHKAAIEQFVHSYGFGKGYPICALRPTGVYGAAHPIEDSKWYEIVHKVARGENVTCVRGGKEVHAYDVARAVSLLLRADGISGESYNCYDRYISEWEVAQIARELTGSNSNIGGQMSAPKNQIETGKIRGLGMTFGGEKLLRETVRELLAS